MTIPAIRVEHLGKRYQIGGPQLRYKTIRESLVNLVKNPFRESRNLDENHIWALKDVSFEIQPGEVVGIIGRNGAGKSTLLKVLAHITGPTEGRVEIRGRIGSLLEVGTGFHQELTGRENIYLNGAVLGMKRTEIDRKFDEIVDFAEIEQFLDTPTKHYSSGMYMRLAFAVAAHLEPEILLVDEVLAVGDAEFQKKCMGKMGEVAHEGRTVLFVSHNMTAILGLCLDGILLDNGSLVLKNEINSVVKSYMSNVMLQNQDKLNLRRNRAGDHSIVIDEIKIGLSDDQGTGYWATGMDCVARFSYRCLSSRPQKNIEVAFEIFDRFERSIYYCGTKVVKQDFEKIDGVGYFCCVIRHQPLLPGSYHLSFDVKNNGIIADQVMNAIDIKVVEGDFYGTGVIWNNGVVLVDYDWDLEK